MTKTILTIYDLIYKLNHKFYYGYALEYSNKKIKLPENKEEPLLSLNVKPVPYTIEDYWEVLHNGSILVSSSGSAFSSLLTDEKSISDLEHIMNVAELIILHSLYEIYNKK